MQVIQEYDKNLRIRIRLGACVIDAPIAIDGTDQINLWSQLLRWDPIGIISATPFASRVPHVRKPTLIYRDKNRVVGHAV